MRELAPHEQDSLDALQRAFSGVEHGLWTGATINAADSRFKEIRALRAKGAANWSAEDFDWLFFKSATTAGTEETTKYAFVGLARALLRHELSGSPSAAIIDDKLEYAKFASWPGPQRRAVLDVLDLLADLWSDSEYAECDPDFLRAFVAQHR